MYDWFYNLTRASKAGVVIALVVAGLLTSSVLGQKPQEVVRQNVASAENEQFAKVKKPEIIVRTEATTEAIPFQETIVEDASIPKGSSRITVFGVNGQKTITHEIELTDGVETGRVTTEETTIEPVAQVKSVGTYVAPSPEVSAGVVKKSRSDICHAPGTTYYDRTKNFSSYRSLDECLSSGGRMPLR